MTIHSFSSLLFVLFCLVLFFSFSFFFLEGVGGAVCGRYNLEGEKVTFGIDLAIMFHIYWAWEGLLSIRFKYDYAKKSSSKLGEKVKENTLL